MNIVGYVAFWAVVLIAHLGAFLCLLPWTREVGMWVLVGGCAVIALMKILMDGLTGFHERA